MTNKLKGGKADDRYPLPDELRDYMLVKAFGWTKQQIDDQPAIWLDWMLNLHNLFSEVENSTT